MVLRISNVGRRNVRSKLQNSSLPTLMGRERTWVHFMGGGKSRQCATRAVSGSR